MAKSKVKSKETAVPETKTTAPPRLQPVGIPVQSMKGVLVPTWQPAVNAEHWFYNQGQNVTWLCVANDGDTAVTLTFTTSPDVEIPPVDVRAQTVAHIGPFPARHYNDLLNRVWFTLSQADDVRLAVERLGV